MRRLMRHKPGAMVEFRHDLAPGMVVVYQAPGGRETRLLLEEMSAIEGITERQDHILRKFVKSVSGYAPYGSPIVDADGLASEGEWFVVKDLTDEILLGVAMTDEERKNLSGSSDLAGQAALGCSETATSAAPGGLTESATATAEAIQATYIQPEKE